MWLRSSVVNQYKGAIGKNVVIALAKSFHEHIVRNEADYRRIWEYIDANTEENGNIRTAYYMYKIEWHKAHRKDDTYVQAHYTEAVR